MTYVEFSEPTPQIARSSVRTVELGFKSAVGRGKDLPVAAVTLASDIRIGEGVAEDQYTGISHLHAEVNAMQRAQSDFPLLRPKTLITNLEPCVDCQDFLSTIPSLETVMFLLSRQELIDINLVNERQPIDESDERPYRVIRLDQPKLHHHGLELFKTAHRETQGENKGAVTFDKQKLFLAQRAFKLFQANL